MKKMGLPEHVIKHKIVSDGFKAQTDELYDVFILEKIPKSTRKIIMRHKSYFPIHGK